jgi:hypothetical protein
VLVQWSIEQNRKTFLPRLGSAIEHTAMDPSGKFIAVSMGNNFIQLIDALSRTVHVRTLGIHGTPFPSSSLSLSPSPLALSIFFLTLFFLVEKKSLKLMTIDPYSKLLVVNGPRGTLQFCDASSGRYSLPFCLLGNS